MSSTIAIATENESTNAKGNFRINKNYYYYYLVPKSSNYEKKENLKRKSTGDLSDGNFILI